MNHGMRGRGTIAPGKEQDNTRACMQEEENDMDERHRLARRVPAERKRRRACRVLCRAPSPASKRRQLSTLADRTSSKQEAWEVTSGYSKALMAATVTFGKSANVLPRAATKGERWRVRSKHAVIAAGC
eukprot:2387134-Rhodomonas_salina.1